MTFGENLIKTQPNTDSLIRQEAAWSNADQEPSASDAVVIILDKMSLPDEQKTQTSFGLILPEQSQDESTIGVVACSRCGKRSLNLAVQDHYFPEVVCNKASSIDMDGEHAAV